MEFMRNDDLMSLVEPYIHDRNHLHSLCLVNKMFNAVFSQSLYEHLVVKHTHVHCIEPDSQNFKALLNSQSLRHTRKLSLLQMDQLNYTRTKDASRYGPILNGAIRQIVKRCPNLRQITFSAPSCAGTEGLAEYSVSKETLHCPHSSCPALQSLSLEQAFPRVLNLYADVIDHRVFFRMIRVHATRFREFSNLTTLRMIGMGEMTTFWQRSIAELLSIAPQMEELSLSLRSPPRGRDRFRPGDYFGWGNFLVGLCEQYKWLRKPPLKLRKLLLHDHVGFVCNGPSSIEYSIEYIGSLTDLGVLEELRVFNNYPYTGELMEVLPHLRGVVMPYRFFTYDTMPRLRRFSFDNMDGHIMEWLIQAAETPFRYQLTLCNDGVDYWEAGAKLFEAVSYARARKRFDNPFDSFTASDLA
ncbi:hypothetical protein RB213_000050 [Colletotrichum asianum]